jgi:hypothetical protein
MRGNPPKTTEEQRLEILRVYKTEGAEAATKLCLSLGLSRRYYSSLASIRGVSRRPQSRRLTEAEKDIIRNTQPTKRKDKRWQWAIQRGVVVA